jgi:GNAT superfamily N-acetyltransferase
MNVLNQDILNKNIFNLKKLMYRGILEDLKLIYNCDEECPYIYLEVIKIRKKYRNQGYGSIIMREIVRLADSHNVQVRLYATSILGSDLKRLYGFYRKFGFVLIKRNNDGFFIRRPRKKYKTL